MLQPRNGILVPDFVGEPDEVLDVVLKLLKDLKADADVRPRLMKLFNLEKHLADYSKRVLGRASSL